MTARGEFPTSRSRSAFRIFRISIDSSGPASASRHVTCAAPEAVPHDPCFAYFAARSHIAPSYLECRRRAGRDYLARLAADAAEAVRTAAFEIIGVAGIEDTAFVVDGHLQAPAHHDAAFLAVMGQRHPAGVAAWFVALLENLQAA